MSSKTGAGIRSDNPAGAGGRSDAVFRDLAYHSIRLGERLGSGGEAEVFAVAGDDSRVAKVYRNPTPERERKLRAMIESRPQDPTLSSEHRSICWPETVIYDTKKGFAGFLMSRIDFSTSRPLLTFYNPLARQRISTEITWQYLVRMAMNICSVMEAIHHEGHVIGDVNESNFLVSNSARVTLVDCDSMQACDNQTGLRYRCPVGKVEFTPPELQGQDLSLVDREITHDHFALGVTIFLLLMEGVHPFMGRWRGSGDSPPLDENIRNGHSPYVSSEALSPSPIAPPFEILPHEIRVLFTRCFSDGHRAPAERPAAAEWHRALKQLDGSLRLCQANGRHFFSAHLETCPWCERGADLRGIDPFPLHANPRPIPKTKLQAPRPQPSTPVVGSKPGVRAGWKLIVGAGIVGLAVGVAGPLVYLNSRNPGTGRTAAAGTKAGNAANANASAPAASEPSKNAGPQRAQRSPAKMANSNSSAPAGPTAVVILPPFEANPGQSPALTPQPTSAVVNLPSFGAKAKAPDGSNSKAVVYQARHKHLVGGCDGVLTLTPEGLVFDSREHPLRFGVKDVRLDGDGITDPSGKNWRFSVDGANVEQILRQWKDGSLLR